MFNNPFTKKFLGVVFVFLGFYNLTGYITLADNPKFYVYPIGMWSFAFLVIGSFLYLAKQGKTTPLTSEEAQEIIVRYIAIRNSCIIQAFRRNKRNTGWIVGVYAFHHFWEDQETWKYYYVPDNPWAWILRHFGKI